MSLTRTYAAVLFDLDGTLVDSAPDLAGAANALRVARGLPPLPTQWYRSATGQGARGMIQRALDIGSDDTRFESLRVEFLDFYSQRLTELTCLFPSVAVMLDSLDAHGVPWGIVTNKAHRFTLPIVTTLGLIGRAGAVVSGDTTPHTKPHPAPLLEASTRMGVAPERCLYVGDDLRDIEAGRSAGMDTASARWGYLGDGQPIDQWGASFLIEDPIDLLKILQVP